MNQSEINQIQARVAGTGLRICLVLPVALLAFGIILRSQWELFAVPVVADSRLVGYILIAAAAADLAVSFFLKRHLTSAVALTKRFAPTQATFSANLNTAFIPVFISAATPAMLGLVFYLLGGDTDTFVLLTVFAPAGMMLVKPRGEEIHNLGVRLLGWRDDE